MVTNSEVQPSAGGGTCPFISPYRDALQGLFLMNAIYWLLAGRISLVALAGGRVPTSPEEEAPDSTATDVEAGAKAKDGPVRHPKLVRTSNHSFATCIICVETPSSRSSGSLIRARCISLRRLMCTHTTET